MTGVAEEGTGGEGPAGGEPRRPARRPLNPLKQEVFRNRPHKLALVEHLRSLIGAADLASKHVAPGVAMSASALSKNLSGDRLPHRSTVEAIIQLCGASEEVRALSLRLHTAALGEAHPAFAERLVMADAYEETVVLHDRVRARLEDALSEHRRQQADHDDLLARHETTSQALAAAEDGLRTQRQHDERETTRLNTLIEAEQDARRRDRTAFDARLDRVRAEHEEQVRAGRRKKRASVRTCSRRRTGSRPSASCWTTRPRRRHPCGRNATGSVWSPPGCARTWSAFRWNSRRPKPTRTLTSRT